MMLFLVVTLLGLPYCAAETPSAARMEGVSPRDCDTAAIDKSAKPKTGWGGPDGQNWTVFPLIDGFSFCFYGNRYVVINEKLSDLRGIELKDGTIFAKFNSVNSGAREYLFSAGAIYTNVAPFRGASAADVGLGSIRFSPSGKPAVLVLRADASFEQIFDAVLRQALSEHWLWNESKANKKLKQWVKNYAKSPDARSSNAQALISVEASRDALSRYLETSAGIAAGDAAVLKTPAARIVDKNGKNVVPPLLLGELFKLLRR